MALNIGTKDHPIHIDFSSDELTRSQPPKFSVVSTSLSLPQRPLTTPVPINSPGKPRNTSRGKVKTLLSPFVTPSLVAEPMTTQSQDVVQSLKRRRVDPEEDLELTKRLKKSENKRRKRERRAARIAQLGNDISSLKFPSAPLHVGLDPEPLHPSPDSLARGSIVQDISLAITMPRPWCSISEPPLSISSSGYHDNHETRHGEEALGLNVQCLFSSSFNSQIALSTSLPSVPVRDPPSSSNDEEGSDNLSNQVINVTNTSTSDSAATSSSFLNRRIKERMALLIEHQRLANGADSLPPVPSHRINDYTSSEPVVGDTISSKQNALDWAISENKAALAQLGTPLSKEDKLILMKTVTERNKLITQLTNEIKTHLDSLRSNIVVIAPIPRPPDNSVMRFKWPETELPLYLIVSNDDEDSISWELSGSR